MAKLRFLLVFLIVLYKGIMYYPFINNHILYLLIIIIAVTTIIIIYRKKYSHRKFIQITILLLIATIAAFFVQSANLLFPVVILLIFDKSEYKTIAKYFFISLVFVFLLTIILNLTDIIPSYRCGEIRYSLGFPYPGFIGLYSFFIFLSAFIAFAHEKRNMVLSLPIALFLYKISLSRAGLIGYLCLLVMAFLPSKLIKTKKFKNLVKLAFPLLTIVIVALTYAFTQGGLVELNEAMSGRLLHYSQYIKTGLLVRPFGSSAIEGYTIDNYFLYFFYDYGFIGYIAWLILNHKSINNMNDPKLLCAMLPIFFYGLFDSNAIVTSINPMISIQVYYFLVRQDKLSVQNISKEENS